MYGELFGNITITAIVLLIALACLNSFINTIADRPLWLRFVMNEIAGVVLIGGGAASFLGFILCKIWGL